METMREILNIMEGATGSAILRVDIQASCPGPNGFAIISVFVTGTKEELDEFNSELDDIEDYTAFGEMYMSDEGVNCSHISQAFLDDTEFVKSVPNKYKDRVFTIDEFTEKVSE